MVKVNADQFPYFNIMFLPFYFHLYDLWISSLIPALGILYSYVIQFVFVELLSEIDDVLGDKYACWINIWECFVSVIVVDMVVMENMFEISFVPVEFPAGTIITLKTLDKSTFLQCMIYLISSLCPFLI